MTNKEGQPYLDRQQRPYSRVSIQTEQHGKRWLSGFAYQDSPFLGWRIGDEVEIEIEEKGQYLNFWLPKPASGGALPLNFTTRFSAIEQKVNEIHQMLSSVSIEPAAPDGSPDVTDLGKNGLEPPLPF